MQVETKTNFHYLDEREQEQEAKSHMKASFAEKCCRGSEELFSFLRKFFRKWQMKINGNFSFVPLLSKI